MPILPRRGPPADCLAWAGQTDLAWRRVCRWARRLPAVEPLDFWARPAAARVAVAAHAAVAWPRSRPMSWRPRPGCGPPAAPKDSLAVARTWAKWSLCEEKFERRRTSARTPRAASSAHGSCNSTSHRGGVKCSGDNRGNAPLWRQAAQIRPTGHSNPRAGKFGAAARRPLGCSRRLERDAPTRSPRPTRTSSRPSPGAAAVRRTGRGTGRSTSGRVRLR